jgi:hypothetical protein
VFLVLEPCSGIRIGPSRSNGVEPGDDADQGDQVPITSRYPLGSAGSSADHQHAKVLGRGYQGDYPSSVSVLYSLGSIRGTDADSGLS